MRLRVFLAALPFLCCQLPAQIAHPVQPPLSYTVALPASPFGLAVSADGNWVFIGLTVSATAGAIAVVQRTGDRYALVNVVPLQNAATGIALTHDGKVLIVAAGPEVYFLDVSGVSSRGANAVQMLGSISDGPNAGSIWVSVTQDDHWVFVCDEDTGQLTVIDLTAALPGGFSTASVVGTIPLGAAPTSIVFSPDGSTAYVTVQRVSTLLGWPANCTQEGSTNPALVNPEGAIVFFNVAAAVSHPSSAVLSFAQFVPAGCSPVRVERSADGLTLYATARNNNEVLALDPSRFASDPMHAIIGLAPVGAAPVPVTWIDSGKLIVVGNSNRFLEPGVPQSLDVLDASQLASGGGASALVRTIPAGAFPRALLLSPDGGTLFLSNYDSNSLQVIDAVRLATAERGRLAPGQ